jgi:uncharacterized protein YkwD
MKTKLKRNKQKFYSKLGFNRRKIITAISVIALIALASGVFTLLTKKDKQPVAESKLSQSTGGLTVSNQPTGNITLSNQQPEATEILKQINNVRASNNLPAISANNNLDQSAVAKLSDMISRNYWAHNAPDGTEPWIFIQKAGYKYQYAGENLWNGYSNSTVADWLISPTHKAVILDARYTEIGIAVKKANNYNGQQNVWVVVTHYASPYTGTASSYKPTANTSTSGSGYQYQLPEYNPTPMPDFDYGRSSPSYQSGTQQNCGSNTDSSYYANCVGQ